MSAMTPGPWGVEQTPDTNWIGPMRKDGEKIKEIVVSIDREGLKPECLARADANAKAIAALPDLIAALQSCVKALDRAHQEIMDGITDSLDLEEFIHTESKAALETLKKAGVL